jgi:hypothetical protein
LTGYPSTVYPQMCFGVAIEEPTNGTVNVNMVFSAFNQDRRTQSIPSTINKVWDEFDINQDTASFKLYHSHGYSLM